MTTSKPLSLDEVAAEMRERQTNPEANSTAQTVWDSELGIFVQLAPGQQPSSTQNPMNKIAKEPFFLN